MLTLADRVNSSRPRPFPARIRANALLFGLTCFCGCSLRDLSDLSGGPSTTAGSSGRRTNVGGKGGSNTGGALDAGGSSGIGAGGSVADAGGSVNDAGGSIGIGGSTITNAGMAGDGVSSGGTTATTNLNIAGAVDCTFTGTGGKLLVPPSQNFETDFANWTTQSGKTAALTRNGGDGSACEGSWYLTTDGKQRVASWDGPAYPILSYVVPGHTYQVSMLARQNPTTQPLTSHVFTLVVAKKCAAVGVTDVYEQVNAQPALANWVRLTGQFKASMTGCTTLSLMVAYLDAGDTAAPYCSIDIDDFRLIDMTPDSGSGGAGAAGAAGAGATAGRSASGGSVSGGAGGRSAGGGASGGGVGASGASSAGAGRAGGVSS